MAGGQFVLYVDWDVRAINDEVAHGVRGDGRRPPVESPVRLGRGNGPGQLGVCCDPLFSCQFRQEPGNTVGVPGLLVRWYGGTVVRWYGGRVVGWYGIVPMLRCARLHLDSG